MTELEDTRYEIDETDYEYVEHPVNNKVYTTLWACNRQRTRKWGCPTIIERLVEFLGEKPDIYFGKTDGIDDKEAVTVDIDPDNKPTIIADWNNLPIADESFDFAFWDPPYDGRYDDGLKEILRVTRRRVAILHQLVYPNPKGWYKVAIIAITTGPNMRARVLQIYDRDQYQPKKLDW